MAFYLCAVDVGTSSARAGVFDAMGTMLARADRPFATRQAEPNIAEHNSEEIWTAICQAVRQSVHTSGISPDEIAGLSFDATCSLVARDHQGHPISVSKSGENGWDTIVWHDHRAANEAAEITALQHPAIAHNGGVMSPEMQLPKLLWLKRHMPDTWERIGYLFDLADFLSWRASGSVRRSVCTLTCKWNYLTHMPHGWPMDALRYLGLEDVLLRARIDDDPVPVGRDLGPLTPAAAAELGLSQHCRVGAGTVDAYAGGLGLTGHLATDADQLEQSVVLIAGTSSCIMVQGQTPRTFGGSWGPYFGAVLPNCWTSEGGQSVSGALLDHVIRSHPAGGDPTPELHRRIIASIQHLRQENGARFAERLHILPDFHGNRSPLADPSARGVISGLTMDRSFENLCALYWRTAVALALGLRHILDELRALGQHVSTLHVAGGHTKNPLLVELYADATGCNVVTLEGADATLLGTAYAAAVAAGLYATLIEAACAMRATTQIRTVNELARHQLNWDYRVFRTMIAQRDQLDQLAVKVPATDLPAGHFSNKKLVIFDCDGVVVDSEVLAISLLIDVLESKVGTVDRQTLTTAVLGQSSAVGNKWIKDHLGYEITQADEAELQERLFTLFRENLKPTPNIETLLNQLAIPYCLASSSSFARLHVALAATSLEGYFKDRIFSAALVKRGKPEPDLFLFAARTMGVDPRDCLVIEDSPAGVIAARRAGMDVIGFTGGSHALRANLSQRLIELGPDAVCSSMLNILRLIAR